MHFTENIGLRQKIIRLILLLCCALSTQAAPTEPVLSVKTKENAAHLFWKTYSESPDQLILIRYKRKIESSYGLIPVLLPSTGDTLIKNLIQNEPYQWQVGIFKDDGLTNYKNLSVDSLAEIAQWSRAETFTTRQPWGIIRFLKILGALGLFIFGMKHMSEALQQAAGSTLRKILGSMTSNRVKGVFSGFIITSLIQSSSATTVMTVSFVNAGLLTLVESAGIVMGANIGTTLTGWLISLFGFKVNLSNYSLIIIALASPFLFLNQTKFKASANALIGFAILFMGLGFLKDSVPTLEPDSPFIRFFTQFKDAPLTGRIVFVGVGALATIIIQSSSAAMALTLALVLKGIVPFDVGAAMILGENIGTTITAEIASLVGNVHAKRSARIHSLFNIIGVSWMVFFIPFFLQIIARFLPADPFNISFAANRESATLALAAFHTAFNTLNVALLIWFVPQLVKLATITVPAKNEEDNIYKLEYITTGLTKTPEIALVEAKREVAKFGNLTQKMLSNVRNLLNATGNQERDLLVRKITRQEDITDHLELEIANYLAKLSEGELSKESSRLMRTILNMINDLERIGDLIFEMAKIIERKNKENLWFDQEQRNELNEIFTAVQEALIVMNTNLNNEYEKVDTTEAYVLENRINDIRNSLRNQYFNNLDTGKYNVKTGMVYSNLFSLLERIGDHIINVTEAAAGKT